MWAIIPVKNVNDAKHRLDSILNPNERRELFVGMFKDVLKTLMAVPELEQVAVATVCPTASEIARRNGISVLSTSNDEGQTAAVALAAKTLYADGIDGMLMLPGDVPLVTVGEIQTVLAVHEKALSAPDVPAMTIVPARDEQGSDCIALSPPTAASLRFGANSYFPHLDNARKLGLTLHTPKLPGIGLDIDTPEDLLELCLQPVRTRAQEFLLAKNIMQRLKTTHG